jgi:hypothetical protein
VTEPAAATRAEHPYLSFVIGALIAFAGHALVYVAAFVAAQVARPGPGDGFSDLVAVVVTFLVGQAVVALGAIVGAVIWYARRRPNLATGLLVGWAAGLAITLVFWARA